MTSLPKRALITAALASAFVGLSATAIAQTAATPAPTAQTAPAPRPDADKLDKHQKRHAERMANMQRKMAERRAALKADLKLTPEQEPAWNAFVARTQPPQQGPAPRMNREDWSKLTTPERLDKMQALKAERDAHMAQRNDAIRSFYGSLNADQKKVFDDRFAQGFQRAGMRHKGHPGGHPHPMGGEVRS
ncbi:Spy/CpxP family protein refolding chaperone [Hydrogenophaga sp.]|uniref:Spy/CpxP family protein refolding chaperone n=1 Tax=Hydrogenophaga sp. TaxID=1904254 RepID=UPI00263998A0|nr:Spy/CpxP family protein refolding chaperone [Hydrogenophaga sp.]MCW5655530.1 Spy/CpxP family protein refolding chaperone [Hydrogenophaga sp.]